MRYKSLFCKLQASYGRLESPVKISGFLANGDFIHLSASKLHLADMADIFTDVSKQGTASFTGFVTAPMIIGH